MQKIVCIKVVAPFCFFITLLLTAACAHRADKERPVKQEMRQQEGPEGYSVTLYRSDSVHFYRARRFAPAVEHKFEKITDFRKASEMMAGSVEFDTNQMVKMIRPANGRKNILRESDGQVFFTAYFPGEHILLCEGGHTTEISFDLLSGKYTEETGNPENTVISPGGLFRINSYFGGQECYTYFLQQRRQGRYESIPEAGRYFEYLPDGDMLCTMREAFWESDHVLWFSRMSYKNDQEIPEYYKLMLKTSR